MSPFGNFNLARQELKKVALKALYKLRKEMGDHFRENIKLMMKLFDALHQSLTYLSREHMNPQLTCTQRHGFIAQLVERRTGIARSRVQAPLKS